VEYEKIACMSLFTLAARYHDMIKSNTIKQARDAIEKGRTEPPFAWLVPPDQSDKRTAAEMLAILHATGIEVYQAQQEFTADGVKYPAETYILYCSQPYRAHLNDMMERQVYPDRSSYPGGPPEAPYDTAGWTLPLQMGARVVSVNQSFEAQAKKLQTVSMPQGQLKESPEYISGFIVQAGTNDNYRLINRLFKTGIDVRVICSQDHWKDITGMEMPCGSLFISDVNKVTQAAPEILEGISAVLTGVQQKYSDVEEALENMPPPHLGLYQPWTASIDEGWTRYVLDKFEFVYTSVHNSEIRAGNLRERYDCLILPSLSSSSIIKGRAVDTTEPQYVGGIDSEGIVALQNFVQNGGTLICIDRSCNLPIEHFNVPVRNILKGKSSKDFYCPGSILRISVDQKHPAGYGCPQWISGYFTKSQAFELIEESKKEDKDSRSPGLRFPSRVVARYSDTVLLESGWIRGAKLITDKPAIVEVQYGKGKIILLGFRVQYRGQSHGTFRLLFNTILDSTMVDAENI
jgi:hypothetical protein